MTDIEDVDDAIYKTLFGYGKLTYNNLYRKTQEIRKCPNKTFDKHLKELVTDNLIIRSKIPRKQNVEYSINQDISEPVQEIIRIMDESTTEVKKLSDEVERFLKKNAQFYSEYKNFVDKKLGALDNCVKCIISSNHLSAWCSFFLNSAIMTKMQERKVKQLQKICFELAQKIFQLVKNINLQAFQQMFFLIFHKLGIILSLDVLESS